MSRELHQKDFERARREMLDMSRRANGQKPKKSSSIDKKTDNSAPSARPTPPPQRAERSFAVMPPVPHFVRVGVHGSPACHIPKQSPKAKPPPFSAKNQRPPSDGFFDPQNFKNLFSGFSSGLRGGAEFPFSGILKAFGRGGISQSSDRMLLMLLIALLSGKSCDKILIFALLYIML